MTTTSPVWSSDDPSVLPLLIVDGRVTSLPVWTARTRAERDKGLLGTDGIAGALWITRCNWIHCFGMRYALEAVYVSRTGQVVSMATHRPGRMGAPRVSAAAVIEMEEYRQEADRLQGLLDLQDQYELTMVTGRVIGTQPSAWNQVITLNVGTDNGVEAGLPVIGPSGLLGQVVSATTSTCDVRLITDPQSGVSVYIQGSRVTGVVRGSLDGLIYLEDVDPSVAVKAGDVLVTSGLGGAYFGGLPVGTVSNVETRAGTTDRTIVVTPLSDVTALQEASVIVQTTSESQATEPSSSNNGQANATKKGGR